MKLGPININRDRFIIFCIIFLSGAAENIFYFMLPIHIRELGATSEQVGLTLSTAGMTMIFAFPIVGNLADRFDSRKLLIGISLVSGLSTFVFAFIKRWEVLALLLPLYYINWTAIPVVNRHLALITSSVELNRAFSTVHVAFSISMIFFPTVGGWLASRFGMSVVFMVSAIFIVLCAVPFGFLPKIENTHVAVTIGHRTRDFIKRNVNLFLFIPALFLFLRIGHMLMPNYLTEELELSKLAVGQLGTVLAIGGVLFSISLGRLKDRWPLSMVIISILVGLVLILVIPNGPFLIAAFFLSGAIEAFFPLISAMIASLVPFHRSGLVFGLQGTLNGLSAMIAAIMAGFLFDFSPQAPIYFSIAALPIALIWFQRVRLVNNRLN